MKLTTEGCRGRQQRLLAEMEKLGLSTAVLADPKHVLYLTGYLTRRLHKSAVILTDIPQCILVSPDGGEAQAVDRHIPFEAQALSTLRLDQPAQVAEKVRQTLSNPNWDHYFQEGDFFTAEPGLYYDELRGGIRLEENYLVTPTGVKRLTFFPLDL